MYGYQFLGQNQGRKERFPGNISNFRKELSNFCWKEKVWKVSKISWKELLKLSDFEIAIRKTKKYRILGEKPRICHFLKSQAISTMNFAALN